MEQSFAHIVMQAQQGDRQALGKLYNICHEPLREYIKNKYSYTIDPDDIIQETFICVYKKLYKLEKICSFWCWICKISRNVIYRYIKNEKKHRLRSQLHPSHNDSTEAMEKGTPESTGFSLLENTPSREKDPMDEVTEREAHEKVRSVIEQLPPNYLDAVKAHYFEELSLAEIARKLGKPEGTIKRWLYEARQMMKEMLAA